MSNSKNRTILRQLMLPFEEKNNALAIGLVVLDYLLFSAGQCLVLLVPIAIKPLGSLIICMSICRLFVLGHDACHGSFTNSSRLNKILGRLAFLPSLTPYHWWLVGHNMTHHGFANLAGTKDPWTPHSPQSYQKLTSIKRLLYRLYRSPFGTGFYYFLEIWLYYLYFPSTKAVGNAAKKFTGDSILVTVFLIIWVFLVYLAANATGQSVSILILLSFALPFIVWNIMMGLIIYLHHTHPRVRWHLDQPAWFAAQPYITSTVHLRFPDWFSMGLHHIMEHPAHHLDVNIPCYHLKAAQHKLEEVLPDSMVIQDFSWRWYFSCTRICKLYDFDNGVWLPFSSITEGRQYDAA